MSRCSCCGGSCTFNCCTNKAPSNVCVEITKTRLLNPVYKISSSTAYVGYGTKSVIGQAECQYEFNHGKYIQYHFHYGTIGTVSSSAAFISGSTTSAKLRANKVNIYMKNIVTSGRCINVSYYLMFPMLSDVHYSSENGCDWSQNYYTEYGFGVKLGGLGEVNYTYDFSSVQQYRMITTRGNGNASYGMVPAIDVSFGEFGLCKCCDDAQIRAAQSFLTTSLPDNTDDVGSQIGYIVAIIETNNEPIENLTAIAATIKSSMILTYDINIDNSSVRLTCPAFSNVLKSLSPNTLSETLDTSPATNKSNMSGWGALYSGATKTIIHSNVMNVDNYIGIMSPKITKETDKQNGYVSQINTINSTDILDSWVTIHNPLEYYGSTSSSNTMPFKLKDLDGTILIKDINNLDEVDGIPFNYPKKISNISNYLANSNLYVGIEPLFGNPDSYQYIQNICDNFISNVTGNCDNIKNGETFLSFDINYLDYDKLYQYSVNVRKMLDTTDCSDISDFIKNEHCNDCYSVFVDGIGYVSKYFRLSEVTSINNLRGALTNIDLFYDTDSAQWKSKTLCRITSCNNNMANGTIIYQTNTVNISLEIDMSGAALTIVSNGDDSYTETYHLPNNNDCALSTGSLLFEYKDDNSQIVNNFVVCQPYTIPFTYYDVPIKYMLIPFFLLYPNGR